MDTSSFRRFLFLFAALLFFLIAPIYSSAQTIQVQTTATQSQSTQTQTTQTQTDAPAGQGFDSEAPSAILMEASTGNILYEKDADNKMAPASVTKIMTLLLIFEALDQGTIQLEDNVTVSEHAASMGGSQVFLEIGEAQTVDTMIKCIAVSSANDASVAMGEYIAGSEEAFVEKMNQKAKKLGMNNTHFVNCCGLDDDNHYSCARDIALMSRELTVNYPEIFEYTGIWMDTITHVTQKGESEFGLSNTNKLIKQYQGATGLKTGSTDKAGFCLSATATRKDISLIGVVMHCESSKARIQAASALLDYGFSKCHIYKDQNPPELSPAKIEKGVKSSVACEYAKLFSIVTTNEIDSSKVEKKFTYKKITAPVNQGDVVGKLIYTYDNEKLGEVNILAKGNIKKAKYSDYMKQLLKKL